MSLVKVSVIPNFLKAPTLEQLRVKMYLNNVRMAAFVDYFDIQKDGTQWVAFYYEELRDEMAMALLPKPVKAGK